jgi:ComF family protein
MAICGGCKDKEFTCKYVRDDRYHFDEAAAVLKYEGAVKDAMLNYKFKSVKYYGKTYAYIMDKETRDRDYLRKAIVCPVPLSKYRKRDYSQTEVLAKELSQLWGSRCISDLLYRSSPVSQLSKMKLPERRFYIRGSIDVNPYYDVYGKDILIIDDIYTSGTTANECARILKTYGADRVFVLCPCYD